MLRDSGVKQVSRTLGRLQHSSAQSPTARLQSHATASQQICNRSDRFTVVSAVCADCEDQVAQCQVFVGLFHGRDFWLGCLKGYETRARTARPLAVRRTRPLSSRSLTAAAASFVVRLTLETANTRSPKVSLLVRWFVVFLISISDKALLSIGRAKGLLWILQSLSLTRFIAQLFKGVIINYLFSFQ